MTPEEKARVNRQRDAQCQPPKHPADIEESIVEMAYEPHDDIHQYETETPPPADFTVDAVPPNAPKLTPQLAELLKAIQADVFPEKAEEKPPHNPHIHERYTAYGGDTAVTNFEATQLVIAEKIYELTNVVRQYMSPVERHDARQATRLTETD